MNCAPQHDEPSITFQRPRTRGECVNGPRPCPWVSCRHHLYLYVTDAGDIRIHHPGEVWEMKESCALDIADQGEATLEIIGGALHVTLERIRQIEAKGLTRLERAISGKHMTRDLRELVSGEKQRPDLNDDRPDNFGGETFQKAVFAWKPSNRVNRTAWTRTKKEKTHEPAEAGTEVSDEVRARHQRRRAGAAAVLDVLGEDASRHAGEVEAGSDTAGESSARTAAEPLGTVAEGENRLGISGLPTTEPTIIEEDTMTKNETPQDETTRAIAHAAQLRELGWSQGQLARHIGHPMSSVSNQITGRAKMSLAVAQALLAIPLTAIDRTNMPGPKLTKKPGGRTTTLRKPSEPKMAPEPMHVTANLPVIPSSDALARLDREILRTETRLEVLRELRATWSQS